MDGCIVKKRGTEETMKRDRTEKEGQWRRFESRKINQSRAIKGNAGSFSVNNTPAYNNSSYK
jgi:hypothetical protein